AFDDIGNRLSASFGGDAAGQNLRQVAYTPNLLNQYTQRGVSDGVDVMGFAAAGSTVAVANRGTDHATYRSSDYFHKLLTWTGENALSALYEQADVKVDGT